MPVMVASSSAARRSASANACSRLVMSCQMLTTPQDLSSWMSGEAVISTIKTCPSTSVTNNRSPLTVFPRKARAAGISRSCMSMPSGCRMASTRATSASLIPAGSRPSVFTMAGLLALHDETLRVIGDQRVLDGIEDDVELDQTALHFGEQSLALRLLPLSLADVRIGSEPLHHMPFGIFQR